MAVKYYSEDWPTNSAKESFEKAVFTKTQKTNARTEGNLSYNYFSVEVIFCICYMSSNYSNPYQLLTLSILTCCFFMYS